MKMIRAILAKKRIIHQAGEGNDLQEPALETWVGWVQRVTAEAQLAMKKHSIPDWVAEQRKKVATWITRLSKMESHRWARQVLDWEPEGRRSRGHPCARWMDQSSHVITLSPEGTQLRT